MQIPLINGAYEAKSIIANAQRCVNLYNEKNTPDSPFPVTHYLTPGLDILIEGPSADPVRCTFRASNGDLYRVVGDSVYYVLPNFTENFLGFIDPGTTPVSMQDNGLVILLCDGTPNLYAIDLTTRAFASVTGENFYGADRVDYVDTFFLLNRPATNQFYISLSQVSFEMLTGEVGSIISGSIISGGDTGEIATGEINAAGSGYTDGSYTDIPLVGGSGLNATIDLTIAGGFVTVATINDGGIDYVAADNLIINTNSLSVAATGTYTFTTNPTNGQTIVLNGVTWTFVTSGATGTQTDIGADLAATLATLVEDLNDSANASISVATYTANPTILTITYDTRGTVGNAYTLAAGTYGGVVSGATLSGGFDATGSGFGFIYTVLTTQGTYVNGTYADVALTGGSGFGARATIVVAGRSVTSVAITDAGSDYAIGDVLTATLGSSGSGFTYTVDAIGGGAFDALDIASKNGYPDPIASLIVMHREIWLVGELTTEVWYNAGAPDFAFQVLPGTFIEHGCVAKYSLCKQDLSVYWLSQDEQGRAMVMRGNDYTAKRISTYAIEAEFAKYSVISDAIGYTYQQEGHTFFVLTFPTANATWVYDQSQELWHQRGWTDNDGTLNRHRSNCCANAYGKILVGDWQNGNLYELSQTTYVDNVDGEGLNEDGSYPIARIRSWPTLTNEGKRVSYSGFLVDMQVGDASGTLFDEEDPPYVSLRWSDDGGRTWGNSLQQSLGAIGRYLTQPQWSRLGMGRHRVFEISWSAQVSTALNGAWIQVTPAGT